MRYFLLVLLFISIAFGGSACKSTPSSPGAVETSDVEEGWDGDTLTVLSLGQNTNPNGTEMDQKKSCQESAKKTAVQIAWQKNYIKDGAKTTGRARYLATRKITGKASIAGIDYDADFNCQAKVLIKK